MSLFSRKSKPAGIPQQSRSEVSADVAQPADDTMLVVHVPMAELIELHNRLVTDAALQQISAEDAARNIHNPDASPTIAFAVGEVTGMGYAAEMLGGFILAHTSQASASQDSQAA